MKIKDFKGLTRLISEATIGINDLVQSVQHEIVHPPFLPSTPIQKLVTGISSISFSGVRLTTRAIGGGLDKLFGILQMIPGEGTSSEQREKAIAALNGVIGDYLEKTENPLALPMQLRYQQKHISIDTQCIKEVYPKITGKILLMVHGLCMADSQWCSDGHDHGAILAEEGDQTPVYLQYNSGLHISSNGQNLSGLLEQLVENWPVPVESLHILGYSMGGLVSRSAIHYGIQEKRVWTKYLRKVAFLGTPHHGTSLEQAGNYVDFVLQATPYLKSFARLGKIRSAGITDLRYGNLVDADWQETDRFELRDDERTPIPLPEGIDFYNIAATKSKQSADPSARLAGDGLVGMDSALGKHKDPDKNLGFKAEKNGILYEFNHMDLVKCQRVLELLRKWDF